MEGPGLKPVGGYLRVGDSREGAPINFRSTAGSLFDPNFHAVLFQERIVSQIDGVVIVLRNRFDK